MIYGIVVGDGQQDGRHRSFIGGRPMLPVDCSLPRCTLCGAAQTFFLQVAFPATEPWAGYSIAVFSCTSCADDDELIPEMMPGALLAADVEASFVRRYQRNFRILVFDTSCACLVDCDEHLRFRPIRLVPDKVSAVGHVGGNPQWILEDESPGSIAGCAAVFLLQLCPGLVFEAADGAPRQIEIALDGTPQTSEDSNYRLFLGNAIYLFGPHEPSPDSVYVLTQVD